MTWKDIEEGRVKVKLYKSWAEWKAEMLNELFRKQGLTGERGRITAETVRHGEKTWDRAEVDEITDK